MTKLATDTGHHVEMAEHHEQPVPFSGFITGAALSTAFWLGVALALWIVRP